MNVAAVTVAELRARVTEKGPWFVVPADTRHTLCRSCGVMVFFVMQPSGKPMPIDVLVQGGKMPHPKDKSDGRGVSHFATCPQASQWRGVR